MTVDSSSAQIQINPGGGWQSVLKKYIDEVSDTLELSGDKEQAIAFGDASNATAEVQIFKGVLSDVPARMPIKITYTRGNTARDSFVGMVDTAKRTLKSASWQFSCLGLAERIRTTKFYGNAVFRRPVATQTSAVSVEDPSSPSYTAGMINRIFWEAGGRPADQDYAYPNAAFYYRCDQALFAPDWTWAAGDDAWAEAQKLAAASCGQLYQGNDGIICYRQPMAYGDGDGLFTFNESVYEDVDEETATGQLATKVVCPYLPRGARPMAEIVNDTTSYLIEPGEANAFTHDYEPNYPLRSLEQASAGQLKDAALLLIALDGRKLTTDQYTQTVTFAAQKVTLRIVNTQSVSIILKKVILRGEPILPGAAGSVSAGTGDIVRNIPENPFIQTKAHALRVAKLTLAYFGAKRPVRTLRGCAYNPARFVGETVYVTIGLWGIVASRHVITAIHNQNTGGTMDVTVVPVDDLPKFSQYYLVGTNNYAGQNKKVGY